MRTAVALAPYELSQGGLAQLVQLGQTLSAWSEEIVAMWRFTRNNGITDGFHNKMELIKRREGNAAPAVPSCDE